jgi:c-di-GMP-binding flagellar brake protein YcgR
MDSHNQENSPQEAKFSDMDLRVGQRVQLAIASPVEHKFYTTVIGYVENEFLMLRVPQVDGWITHLTEGMQVDVRLFSGVSIFSFKSRIDALLLNPRNYMLMHFPSKIDAVRMRAHARVRTQMPVKIVEAASAAVKASGFHLHDLSGGGASVLGPVPLGPIGGRIRLGFDFTLQSTNEEVHAEQNATIQSLEEVPNGNKSASSPLFQHGVQFDNVDPRMVLLVYELQQEIR